HDQNRMHLPPAHTRSNHHPHVKNEELWKSREKPSARVFWQSQAAACSPAQRTSSYVVASCGLLPRTTRPGPRLRTAFWSVASLPLREARARVQDLVGPYYGVQCHPERSEPASEVEGSAPPRLERLGRGSFAGSG